MLRASNSVEIDPPEDTVDLPREMPSTVKDQCAEFPTHMLAVSSLETPPRVLVYPVHHIILATSCANLPVVRKTEPRTPSPAGEISIPVLGIKIPCPETFGLLNIFLYKKDTLWLLGMLLPTRNATPAGLLAFDIEADAKELFEFRVMLRQTFSDHVLAKYMKTVNGLWRNAVALGVCNDEFWDVLDLAWNILLGAATQ